MWCEIVVVLFPIIKTTQTQRIPLFLKKYTQKTCQVHCHLNIRVWCPWICRWFDVRRVVLRATQHDYLFQVSCFQSPIFGRNQHTKMKNTSLVSTVDLDLIFFCWQSEFHFNFKRQLIGYAEFTFRDMWMWEIWRW